MIQFMTPNLSQNCSKMLSISGTDSAEISQLIGYMVT